VPTGTLTPPVSGFGELAAQHVRASLTIGNSAGHAYGRVRVTDYEPPLGKPYTFVVDPPATFPGVWSVEVWTTFESTDPSDPDNGPGRRWDAAYYVLDENGERVRQRGS
jgi:hypothetical protein